MRALTLASLKQSGWRPALHVEMDCTSFVRRQERQEHTALAALRRAADVDPEYTLFLEDDLIFNQHLHENLERWTPLKRRQAALASLYNPNIRETEVCPEEHWFIADPNAVYGSQAFILSRALLHYCIDHWWTMPGMQDIKISRMAAAIGGTIFYHRPSLVQHRQVPSVWGGGRHWAKDFDPEWNGFPSGHQPLAH